MDISRYCITRYHYSYWTFLGIVFPGTIIVTGHFWVLYYQVPIQLVDIFGIVLPGSIIVTGHFWVLYYQVPIRLVDISGYCLTRYHYSSWTFLGIVLPGTIIVTGHF